MKTRTAHTTRNAVCKRRKKPVERAAVREISTPAKSVHTAFSRLEMRQQAFVRQYLVDFNATRAAIAAGYSAKTARAIACENLTKPDIREAVTELIEESGITRERIMREVARMAFRVDLADFDELHKGKTLSELRERGIDTSLIKKIKTRVECEGRGDNKVAYEVREIELRDRLSALEMLARLAGLLTRDVEGGGRRHALFTEDNLADV